MTDDEIQELLEEAIRDGLTPEQAVAAVEQERARRAAREA